jgi:hypothetical protein
MGVSISKSDSMILNAQHVFFWILTTQLKPPLKL